MKLEHFLTSYTKINSKWIKDLNIRPESVKFLEENISSTHLDINDNKILFDPPPRAMEIKTNKWDLIKLENFCTSKEIINKVKRQLSEWEKIIASKTTGKGLFSSMYKQLTQLNIMKKKKQPKQKMGRRLKQTFLQRCTDG